MASLREVSSNQVSTPKFAEEDKNCPICLATMKKVVSLTCGHSFDEHCVTRALKQKTECPLCKQKNVRIFPTDPEEIQRRAAIFERTALLQKACDEKRATEPTEEPVEEVKSEEGPQQGEDEMGRPLFQTMNRAEEELGQDRNRVTLTVTARTDNEVRQSTSTRSNVNLDDYVHHYIIGNHSRIQRLSSNLCSQIMGCAIGVLAVYAYNYFRS